MKYIFLLIPFYGFALSFPEKTPKHSTIANEIVISSQGTESSRIGLEIYKKSKNIIDAFVAVSFAISVERPQSTGLGGGGFALIKLKGKAPLAYDFRESAPLKAQEKMYQDEKGQVLSALSKDGGLAIAVPGLVRGLYEIHKKYGKLSWGEVLAPAIKLAQEGIVVYPHLAEAISLRKDELIKHESSRKIFLKKDLGIYKVGEKLIQSDLAKTLTIIAKGGAHAFYEGELTDEIVSSINKSGGIFSKQDLKDYQVKLRRVVKANVFGHEIISMPPPSSGGIHVIQILKLLEGDKGINWQAPNTYYKSRLAAAMGFAFFDRAKYLGDSDFVSVNAKMLLSDKHLAPFHQTLKKDVNSEFKLPRESNDTTHFSIMDNKGNIISSTQTINGLFGSAVVAGKTGIVLNNEMDDFSAKTGELNMFGAIGGANNKIEAKKRPLSSMSPTIVLKNSKPTLALGSPNGTRIITCVTQVLLNKIAFNMSLEEAVAFPRLHYQLKPDELWYETDALIKEDISYFKINDFKPIEKSWACRVQATAFENNKLIGVSDPRGTGASLGY